MEDPAPHPQAARALDEEQRFRLLVAGVKDYAIYMLDTEGQIASWNAGAERFKGYAAEEVIGRHFSMFYTDEDRAAGLPVKALSTAREAGQFEAEGWRVRKDGTRFWASVVVDPIRNEQGELIGFAKVTRDITERKKAAEALEQANAALFQAQKMEAIGQLTGGIAHDFNNLLAVMSSGLDVLSLRQDQHSDRKLLESMRRAVDRGAQLTQQLLSFARRQPLQAERCDLNALIGGFEAVLRRACGRAVEFRLHTAASLNPVMVDAVRFEAALLNLVVNARDAMPNGGSLVIATENIEVGEMRVGNLVSGSYVRVQVRDNGSGMLPEVRSRAFEPFFSTKGPGKGTGLGLSQVYGFMVQSGGEVTLESEPGRGTTVSLYLPALALSQEEAAAAVAAPEADVALLVDDEPEVLDVAAELFRSLGYAVLTAGDGSHAAEILRARDDIRVLFSDVVMPGGMSGLELAQLARGLHPRMKIILASGYAMPALKGEHAELGKFDFLNKPYRLADLARKLRSSEPPVPVKG